MSENVSDNGAVNLDDDGWAVFVLDGCETRLDLFQTANRIHEISKRLAGKPNVEFHEAILDLMGESGMPRGSHRLADKFVNAIYDRLEAIKKKPNSSPA